MRETGLSISGIFILLVLFCPVAAFLFLSWEIDRPQSVVAVVADGADPAWPYAVDSGMTITQNWHGLEGWEGHDLSAGCGTPLYAPISGRVVFVGTDGYVGPHAASGEENSALQIENDGFMVTLLHGRYIVTAGQMVARGDLIGYEDKVGNTTGCHTHFIEWRK